MPMFPSSSSAVRQLPAPGTSPKMSATTARAPPLRARSTAAELRSTPSAYTPRWRQLTQMPPRAASHVQHRPPHALQHTPIERIGGSEVAPNRERQRGSILESEQWARWPTARPSVLQRALVERERFPHRIVLERSGESCAGSDRSNGLRVIDRVDVPQQRLVRDANAELREAQSLALIGVAGAHRDTVKRGRVPSH